MRSYLNDDERHEYLMLVAELGALEEDIERARAAEQRATARVRLDVAAHHDPAHAPVHGERVRLADGGEIVIRPIEGGDAHDLAVGLQQLGALSRLRRFRAPVRRLSRDELRALTDVDHVWHEATVTFDADTGEGIGVARYTRDREDPAQAEFTCAVLDAWQHRGVGTALAEHLAARARASGIARFTARTVVGNEPARRLMARIADSVTELRAGGTIELSGQPRLSAETEGPA
jgi:RimJ/RimL family protein N-acetyltransferase